MSDERGQRVDVPALLASVDLVAVVGRFVDLKRTGSEYEGRCPFHDERTASFTVVPNKGFAHCFGCGAHHNAISFVQTITACTFREACEQLGHRDFAPAANVKREQVAAPAEVKWLPLLPVPDAVPALMRADGRTVPIWNAKRPVKDGAGKVIGYGAHSQFRPVRVDEYRNMAGQLLGYVLRVEFSDKKITPVVTWCVDPDGNQQWCLRPFPSPRPMQGLDALVDPRRVAVIAAGDGRKRMQLVGAGDAVDLAPGESLQELRNRTVLVVEGEKCRAAGAGALPQYAVVSWPGGSKGIGHVDWSPLKGRDVVLWPDADDAGAQAMLGWNDHTGLLHRGVAQHAHRAGATSLRIIDTDGMPKGWDIADAIDVDGWSPAQLRAWASHRVVDITIRHEPGRPAK